VKKILPWIIRGIIILVYIGLAIGEVITFLDHNYDVSEVLYRMVMIPSLIGFIYHAFSTLIHGVIMIIRFAIGKAPLKSVKAAIISMAICAIILMFGLMTAIFSCAAASV